MPRIAIGGFLHETNCFVPMRTDYAYYARGGDFPPLSRGQEIIERTRGSSYGMSGFIDEMIERHELVPLIWGHAGAGGYVTDDAFERIVGELVGGLSQNLPVDAVYLDLHGAMCSESFEDAESEILRRVRACVGRDIPIVISLDYHANIGEASVELSDGMAIYLTYPHIDRQHTGARSARILERIFERGQPTHRAFHKIPFLLPLNFQCTLVEPSKALVDFSAASEGGEIANLCYAAGFPPSDLAESGPSVVCHGWSEAEVSAKATALAKMVTDREPQFAEELLDPDTAVTRAIEIARTATRPVIIADTQDNPGCGGTCDTTGMLAALVHHNAKQAVMGVMYDRQAAAAAHEAGIGASITIDLGGKHHIAGVTPFHGTFKVSALSDGRFVTTGKSIPGRHVDLGPCALLSIGGVTVLVASSRMQAFDQDIFRHIGIDPAQQSMLVLKSTCHFRADFEPIAEAVLIAVAPGAHVVDATQYPFTRLRPGVRLSPMGPEFRATIL